MLSTSIFGADCTPRNSFNIHTNDQTTGYSVAVIGALPAGAVYFTTYEYVKRVFRRHEATPTRFIADFGAGLLAEVVSCILWCPVDIIKERLQVQKTLGSHAAYQYTGPVDAIRTIYRSDGLRGFYRAYGATLVRKTARNLGQLRLQAVFA